MRRTALALLVLCVFACDKRPASSEGVLPSRARNSPGEFPDNPLLAHVPADTPYVLATFKPMTADYLTWIRERVGPLYGRALDAYMEGKGSMDPRVRGFFDELSKLDFDAIGIDTKARGVVYGIGKYPVMRVELASGAKLLAYINQLATRYESVIPPPTERAGYKLWTTELRSTGLVLLVAVAEKEVVVAVAPLATLDASMPLILGETQPTAALHTADLKAVAARDGYTGQAVGYLDVARIISTISDVNAEPPACRDAILALAKRAPRVTIGYDDFTKTKLAFGVVVELAPDVLAEAREMSGSLAGLPRILHDKPMMGMAIAANVDKSRAFLDHLSRALSGVAASCPDAGLDDAAGKLHDAATAPLPPIAAGIHGAVLSLRSFPMPASGTSAPLEGYIVGQVDHADDVLRLLAAKLPGLPLAADGKARPLPSAVPFPGHEAATKDAIAVAFGSDSEHVAADVLHDKPMPAPLMAFAIDYPKLGAMTLRAMSPAQQAMMGGIFNAFGMATLQMLIDERGLVFWGELELH